MKLDRVSIINHIISKHNIKSYLEIGVRSGTVYNTINCPVKIGVDPKPLTKISHVMTSDAFFQTCSPDTKFGLVFVDGLHLANQVLRDLNNSLKHLAAGGFIVVHDCNPRLEEHQSEVYKGGVWNGTVWKAWATLRMTRADLSMTVIDTDNGCGIIKMGSQQCFQPAVGLDHLNWGFLEKHRVGLLNLVSEDKFEELF